MIGVDQGGRPVLFITRFWILSFAALMFAPASSAKADALCVNQKAKKGCYSTIGAAVAAAKSGDSIHGAPGSYREQVIINKSGLSLIGLNSSNTIVDASGNANGVGSDVDGMDSLAPADIGVGHHAGINEVVVQGFAVTNAGFEGIL